MRCKDVMTADPKYCRPEDSVVEAARIMSTEDVGPVPVVADPAQKKVVGIITDRDIAVKVVAAGRDPQATRISEVMSQNVYTCRAEDDYAKAVHAMAQHQVRRIPIVNRDGSLAGIISQADVARRSSEREVGEVVEEISETPSTGLRLNQSTRSSGEAAAGLGAGTLLTAAACLAGGAAMMFLFDPDRGRRRRTKIARRTADLYEGSAEYAGKLRDLRDRAAEVVAGAKKRF